MAKINLLPPKLKDDIRYSKRNKSLAALVFFLLFLLGGAGVLAGIIYVLAIANLNSITKDRRAKEADRDAISFITVAGEKINVAEESARLQRKISAIGTIEKEQLCWSKALEELSVLTPDSIYLKSLPLNQETKTRMNISGFAVEQLNIAAYRNALEDSKFFKNVDIETFNTQIDSAVGKFLYNFSVSMAIEQFPRCLAGGSS